jgi:hypothetical protein
MRYQYAEGISLPQEIFVNIHEPFLDKDESSGYYVTQKEYIFLSGELKNAESITDLVCRVFDEEGREYGSTSVLTAGQWQLDEINLQIGINRIVFEIHGETKASLTIVRKNPHISKVQIDRSEFDILDETGEVNTFESIIGLKGTLEGVDETKELYLLTKDSEGFTENTKAVSVEAEWVVREVELKPGKNIFEIVAYLKDGSVVSDVITIYKLEDEQQETVIDRNDDDEDGVPNYYEQWKGTRIDLPDTDHDGLSDYEELFLVGTDPNEPDSDYDGINDTDDDEDGDGLSNLYELLNLTDPLEEDTDKDGLYDGDEVNLYQTNPTDRDSDGDLVIDGQEISMGTDPNCGEEMFPASFIATDDDVVTVSVEADLRGWQVSSLSVHRDDWAYFIPEDSQEHIGGVYDFNVEGTIEEAVIKFEFPERYLNDPDLRFYICHLNEKTGELEPLETCVEGNVAFATVNHFSLYMLIAISSTVAIEQWIYSRGWQPWVDVTPFLKEKDSEVVIVIEDSASMQYNDPDRKRLEVARKIIDAVPEGCRIGLIRCADKARSFTEDLTVDKEMLKAYLTEEHFPATGKGGFNSGTRLAFSMLDVDDVELEKHIIYLIDDSDAGEERPIGTLQYEFKNVKCGVCEFVALEHNQMSLENLENLIWKTALGNYTTYVEIKEEGSVEKLIGKLIKNLTYVDDKTDSDDDGLPDLYELCTTKYRDKDISLNKAKWDSDGDYLLDGEEVIAGSFELSSDGTEIRVKVYFMCNPCETDTDGDGLCDEDEVFIWETNPERPDSDLDGIEDGQEVELGFDPLEEDGDHDGKLDAQELADGTSPYVYDKTWSEYLAAFAKGFLAGDFIQDPQDLATISGQLVGSFMPFIDIRDVAANTFHGDPVMTGLSGIGLLPVIGDLAGSSGKCIKYVAKSAANPAMVVGLFAFLDKNFPDFAKYFAKSDEFEAAVAKMMKSDLSKMTDAEVDALTKYLKKTGYTDNIVKGLEKLSKPSAEKLRRNMIKAGKKVPSYANAAHHIVPGTKNNEFAKKARTILMNFNIDINDAVNGVFLPTQKGVTNAMYHHSLHTDVYCKNVFEMLEKATSKDEAIDILKGIEEALLNGAFPR